MSLVPVASLDDLSRLGLFRGGILVFKHSTRCSISTMALNRVQKWVVEHPDSDIAYLDVVANRSLSLELADQWSVEHESPQILWRSADGRVLHESHMGISSDWFNSVN